jgi:hypothetical protein
VNFLGNIVFCKNAEITEPLDLFIYFKLTGPKEPGTLELFVVLPECKSEEEEQYLTTARDLLTLGNNAFARVKAKDEFDKANESYHDGLKPKKEPAGGI